MIKSDITPMMKQYLAAKQACPDALLLFRMGDFYEMFLDDAVTAAKVLGLTLTSRERGENATPMAGFPYHQLDSYVGKLIKAGYRAAVCDQMEDPKTAKGLVKREVTRVVTAGTIIEESLLDPKTNNYLAGITDTEPLGLAWAELSTGKLYAMTISQSQLTDELARIAPSECILPEKSKDGIFPAGLFEKMLVTKRPDWAFGKQTAIDSLLQHFKTTTLEGFGFTSPENDTPALCAAGAVLDYLCETQKHSLEHLDTISPYQKGAQLEIDLASRRSLEITRTIREGRRDGSLLAVLDQCVTAMGSRLLGDWVAAPLTDIAQINIRLEAVGELQQNEPLTREIRETLKKVYDIERLLTRIIANRATPRDLSFLGKTLKTLPIFKSQLSASQSVLLRTLADVIDPCDAVTEKLEAALIAECPLISREGGFIRDGYNAELDSLRDLQAGGKRWIAEYQKQESEALGLPNLKVGFNRVFGYYIEITNTKRADLPADYIRKQTVKNAERYITPTLKEYEDKVLTAGERANELEYELFMELRETVSSVRSEMHKTASALSHLDVLTGFAVLARDRNYCRPEIVEEPILNIIDGRHPVLDVVLPNGTFVPNDAKSDKDSGMIHLITGPNMAGKSTFIRQIALLSIMAQIGSYIPAKSAVLGVADRIFARVGASDELARGQSTFMVEMTETARILNMATPRSIVILDEIGRGTSTFDGISLAWSIVEYMHDRIGCRTFFATHYHELTALAERLDKINNLNVAVREWNDEIAFLHKIVPGAADKSYGIHVARLAGVPKDVVKRADEILIHLEDANNNSPEDFHILDRNHSDGDIDVSSTDSDDLLSLKPNKLRQKLTPHLPNMLTGEQPDLFGDLQNPADSDEEKPPLLAKQILAGGMQLSLFGFMEHPILEELRHTDLNKLTPLETFQLLTHWQQQLASSQTPPAATDSVGKHKKGRGK